MSKPIISIEITEANSRHTKFKVFNRGGYAGNLTVLTDDADEILGKLRGDLHIEQAIGMNTGSVVGLQIESL